MHVQKGQFLEEINFCEERVQRIKQTLEEERQERGQLRERLHTTQQEQDNLRRENDTLNSKLHVSAGILTFFLCSLVALLVFLYVAKPPVFTRDMYMHSMYSSREIQRGELTKLQGQQEIERNTAPVAD